MVYDLLSTLIHKFGRIFFAIDIACPRSAPESASRRDIAEVVIAG